MIKQSKGFNCDLKPGSEVIKLFFMLNSDEHEIFSANKYENANNSWHFHIYKQRKFHAQQCFARKLEIVSNLIFISRRNFMLSWVEHEKRFITSGPEHKKATNRTTMCPTSDFDGQAPSFWNRWRREPPCFIIIMRSKYMCFSVRFMDTWIPTGTEKK